MLHVYSLFLSSVHRTTRRGAHAPTPRAPRGAARRADLPRAGRSAPRSIGPVRTASYEPSSGAQASTTTFNAPHWSVAPGTTVHMDWYSCDPMRALHTRYSTVPLRHRQHKMYRHIVRPHLAAVRAHHSQLFTPYRDTVKRADTRDAVGTPYGGALMSRSKAFPVDGLRCTLGTSPTDKSYRGTNDTVTKHGSGTHLKYFSSHRIRSQSLRSAFQGEFGAASPAFLGLSTLLFFPCAVDLVVAM